jgi:RNA polymerase sigma factor (sigma-70 family)
VRELHPPEPPDDLSLGADELWDVLAKLTEDQRIAIVLKYHGRFRSSEIAEIMDIAPSTVRYHLRVGLAALREELEL